MAYKLLRPPACLTFNSLLNPTHLSPHFPSRPPSFSSCLPLHFPSSLSFTSLQGKSAAILATQSSQVSEETALLRLKATPTNVVDILEQRGLLESLTNEAGIRSVCSGTDGPVKVYCGFDPTAESLHLGNLLGLIVLSWFQRCGHIPVAVLGGATARVGDPSGKSAERPVLGETMIKKNLEGVEANIVQVLRSTEGMRGTHPVVILNNYDWWKEVALLDFLRDVGKYARVGTMTAKESVKKRLQSEEGMSFTEFTYQLLQGYDFVRLFKEEGVRIQIGGSDQWGNITAGTDLIRKTLQEEGAYGLTFPLLLKSDGSKFGKSEGGAIWLSSSMLSPYKFYQHLFATPDADVIPFLKRLTFVGLDEIEQLEREMGKPGYSPNTAQRKLAEEVTKFVHGEQALLEALAATEALAPGAATRLDAKMLEAIAEDVPSVSLPYDAVLASPIVDLCVSVGLLPSKGAARRLIKQGGLYLNNGRVEDESKAMDKDDIVDGTILLLSAGKKNKMLVRIVEE